MRDSRTGTTTKPKPSKSKPQKLGPGLSGEHAQEGPKPAFRGHDHPPSPTLKQAGFVGSILDFNDHVARIVQAHQGAFGYDPPAGVTLDIAKSGLQPDEYQHLFPVVAGAGRRALQIANQFANTQPDDERLLAELKAAVDGGRYEEWIKQNGDDLARLGKEDPEFARKYAGLVLKGQKQRYSGISTSGGWLFDAIGIGAKAIPQITTGLTVGPATAIVEEGKAGYHDVGAVAHGNVPTHLVETNVKFAKAAVQGVKYDITHPGDAPGYLFLDVLGLASGGAGLATRLGRAATAGTAREAASALVRRPRSGTVTLKKGGMEAEVPLSENQLVAGVRRAWAGRQNKAMAKRFEADDAPAGMGAISRLVHANDLLDKLLDTSTLSGEASLRRARSNEKRTEHILMMEPVRELERAAGWSVTAAPVLGKVFNRLPETARKGLTVGEQKALQVLTLDDPTPLQTWREFHRKMLEWEVGDPKAHRAQLAALNLAEQAMKSPSKRFKEVQTLLYDAIAKQEQLKIDELGLSPDTANRRVIAMGEVVRSGEHVGELPAERLSERSAYVPAFTKGKGPRRVSTRQGGFQMREAGYGLPPGRLPPELKHEFTGEAIRAGDFRIDTTNLVGETYARTVRLATIRNDHKNLWSASTATRRSEYDVPIRDVTEVPKRLKEVLEEIEQGQVTARELEQLHPEHVKDLLSFLYPGKKLDNGRWKITGDVKNVRWVNPQLVESYKAPLATRGKLIGQVINEPFRDITLFYRLAYALNAVSNAGMLVLQQGHHTVPNLTKAIYARKMYGDKVTDALDALVGQSKSRAYAPDFDHVLLKAGRGAAAFWNKVADQAFRRAAIIYELKRRGIKEEDFEKALTGEGHKAEVHEAKMRANDAMVRFDNLTWYEKEHLRNYIFVYPWVSRSFVWSIKTILEHPIKVAVLAQIGAEEMRENPLIFSKIPDWFQKTGYVPTGFDKDGNPKIVNGTSINVFSTLNQMVALGEALAFQGGPQTKTTASELGGPFAKFATHAWIGLDEFGNPYDDADLVGAAKEVLLGLPQASARERANRKNPPLKDIDLTNRRTLVEREHSALNRSVLSPGWLNGYGMLITGGLTERTVDVDAKVARYWQEQSPAARHKHEMQLVRRALGLQSQLLGQKLPAGVKAAVDIAGERTWAYQQETKKLGTRGPTPKEQAHIDITIYAKRGLISKNKAEELDSRLKELDDPTQVSRFKDALSNKYGHAGELRQWDADVRLVASFKKDTLQAKLKILRNLGLTDMHSTPGSQDELYAAGRHMLRVTKEAAAKLKALENNPNRTQAEAELRLWWDEHDQPIKVNGKVVAPSPVRLRWATETSKEKQEHVAALLSRDWGSMTNFDKELVGKKVPLTVARGWAKFAEVKAEYQKENPGSNLTPDQKLAVFKQMEKFPEYKGILNDYLFSRKPTIQRLELLKPYQQMPASIKTVFDREIGDNAKAIVRAFANPDYGKGELKGVWKNFVAAQLLPWLQQPQQRNLWAWVDAHGGTSFLNGLVN